MAFGSESTNPRECRAFAHAKLARLKDPGTLGDASYSEALEDAFRAVVAAAKTEQGRPKERQSGFAGRLAREAIVIGDLSTDPEAVKLWSPLTGGSDISRRRDGRIIDDSGEYKVLDVVSYGDTCCVNAEQAAQADDVWGEGEVLLIDTEEPINCLALLLPRRNVPAEWIGEALSRHYEAAVSPPGLVV